MNTLPGTLPPRTSPLAPNNLTFRGGILTASSNQGQHLLMIAKDYDELRIKLDDALGKGVTPLVGVPSYPWFYRRRAWTINTEKQADYIFKKCVQSVGPTTNMHFDQIMLIEIDFDSPLVPNNSED